MTGKGAGRVGSAFWAAAVLLPSTPIETILACDPGMTNFGLAEFRKAGGRWACIRAWKSSPLVALDLIEAWLDPITRTALDVLLVESFVLYPWAMEKQGYSSMGTPEVIGVIRWLHRRYARGPLVMQGANFKARGKARMVKDGVQPIGPNVHARDAEAHGWALIDRMENPASRRRANKAAQAALGEA